MKQYLDKDQTAKLIELGFPKPQYALPIRQEGQALIHALRYTIGELIEFLPEEITDKYDDVVSLEFNKTEVYYENFMGVTYHTNGVELIDALFDMCVTLKEEGVI